MKVSVITVCYNSAETIGATLQSVIGQDHGDIEYIIVDGKSTDGTLQIIEKYREQLSAIISEKDEGIYFAINKGIAAATGEIIAILHADDFYADASVISTVVRTFLEKNTDTVYGDLQYVDRRNASVVKRHWQSGAYTDGLFRKGWMPPHPAFFLRKEYYDRYGSFNTTFASAADYELMLRMLEKHKVSTAYLPEVLVRMRTGGVSNITLKNHIRANREDRRAWKINGLKPGWFTLIRKPLSKLTQFWARANPQFLLKLSTSGESTIASGNEPYSQ